MLLLLKAYGQQLASKYVLSGVSSVADIERHSAAVRRELESGIEVSLSKTNFMYLCQITAIYQAPETQGSRDVPNLVDIKTFKSKHRRVPLVDFTQEARPAASRDEGERLVVAELNNSQEQEE